MTTAGTDDREYDENIPTPDHDDDNSGEDEWAPESARGESR